MTPNDATEIARLVDALLEALGHPEAQRDAELRSTPQRVAALLMERFAPEGPLPELGVIPTQGDGVIEVRGIPFHSMCAHHMVPFFGQVDIAYAPAGRLTGFGAFERLVQAAALGPQLQERMAARIADTIDEQLAPVGVIVRIRARQMCMELAGHGHASDTRVLVGRGAWQAAPAEHSAAIFGAGEA